MKNCALISEVRERYWLPLPTCRRQLQASAHVGSAWKGFSPRRCLHRKEEALARPRALHPCLWLLRQTPEGLRLASGGRQHG